MLSLSLLFFACHAELRGPLDFSLSPEEDSAPAARSARGETVLSSMVAPRSSKISTARVKRLAQSLKGHGINSELQPERAKGPYFQLPAAARFPLEHTEYVVDVNGTVMDVTIRQTYHNDGDQPIEAVYVFPMSTRAAVHDMEMKVGERSVRADMQRKQEARENYEQALSQGKTASLLEQHADDVFQMNVGNILAGESVEVELSYTEHLLPVDGITQLVFPTVVGPRFTGESPDSTDGLSNPTLPSGVPSPSLVDFDIELRAPVELLEPWSTTHSMELGELEEGAFSIILNDAQPNQDLIIEFESANEELHTGALIHRDTETGMSTFLATIDPPTSDYAERLAAEYVFVVDVSGSMMGQPIHVATETVKELLAGLGPADSFNILTFAGSSQTYFDHSVPVTDAQIERAIQWLSTGPRGGGTYLIDALNQTFALPKDATKSRNIVVITDGYVNVQHDAMALIRAKLGEGNLFSIGIGRSVNRSIIEGMARAGYGEPFVITDLNDAAVTVDAFIDYASNPVLTDISVEVEGVQLEGLTGNRLPDLFRSRPLELQGRFMGEPRGQIIIEGLSAEGRIREVINLGDAAVDEEADEVTLLWARQRIAELGDQQIFKPEEGLEEQITALGLEHSLMTNYTSFVAIDEVVRLDGSREVVKQPLSMPTGVADSALGAHSQTRAASQIMGFKGQQAGGISSAFSLSGIGGGGFVSRGKGRAASGYGSGAGQMSAGEGAKAKKEEGKIGKSGKAKSTSLKLSLSEENDLMLRVLRRYKAQLKYCHSRQQAGAGQVKLKLVVVNGLATATLVSSDFDEKVEKCQISRFRRMKFPTTSVSFETELNLLFE